MSTFVLIHGGWHAAWCWRRLVPLLEGQGHRVIAPDLPAHGADSTPLSSKPYEMYVPKICALLDGLEDRAIVVGHSSGGMIMSEAYRQSGERFKALVYLTAFLLPSGKTPRDVMKMDGESLLPGCVQSDAAQGVSVIKKECAKSVFYADCGQEEATWAISLLQPEPMIPPGPVAVGSQGGEPVGRTPRFYIECLQDKALGPSVQRWMYTESRCDGVYSLDTSHSPFLSAPADLAACLLDIDRIVSQDEVAKMMHQDGKEADVRPMIKFANPPW